LLVERAKHPQENRYVPVIPQKHLWIAKLIRELPRQFFLCEQGLELGFLDAQVRICAAAPSTSYHFMTHHVSSLAVMRAGTKVSLQKTAAVPMDCISGGSEDFFQRL